QSPTTPPHPSRRTGLACLRQQAQGADITRESGLTDHAWMACNGALSLSLLDRGRPPSLLPLPLLARSRPWRASSSQVASSSGSPIGARSSAACRGPSPLHTPPAAPRLRPPLPVLLPCTGASCLLPSDSSHPAIGLRTVRNFTPRNGWSDGRQAQVVLIDEGPEPDIEVVQRAERARMIEAALTQRPPEALHLSARRGVIGLGVDERGAHAGASQAERLAPVGCAIIQVQRVGGAVLA